MRWMLLYLSLLALPVSANPFSGLHIITEEYPPYNYTEQGKLTGSAVDLLVSAAQGTVKPSDIDIWPWPRGYLHAQQEPKTLLFSTTRTASRENLFKWVGPIDSIEIVILIKKHSPYTSLTSLIESGSAIGVIRDDIGEILSIEAGIPESQLQRISTAPSLAKMLIKNRVQAWAYEKNVALWHLEKMGYSRNKFYVLKQLKKAHLYFATSTDVPDSQIEAMNKAIKTVLSGTH